MTPRWRTGLTGLLIGFVVVLSTWWITRPASTELFRAQVVYEEPTMKTAEWKDKTGTKWIITWNWADFRREYPTWEQFCKAFNAAVAAEQLLHPPVP